jgi:hypothetical protein
MRDYPIKIEKFDFFEFRQYACCLSDINGAEKDGDIILAKNLIFVKNFISLV